jgi:6-phosphogluconolactonase (cycloisomerase 2 family)
MRFVRLVLLCAALAACARDDARLPVSPDAALESAPAASVGHVYTIDNSPTDNRVLIFNRAADGSLSPAGSVSTDGTGTGGGLGNQGAVILFNRLLLAVSAGSNELTSFRVGAGGSLTLINTVASGGVLPVSVAAEGRLVYVLNAGGTGNISGFSLSSSGVLSPIAGSSRPLSSGTAGAAQIEFARNGRVLIVTEKATNNISTYTVAANGMTTGPLVTASHGQTPFGFGVRNGLVVVSEAFGGAPDLSALSSYEVGTDGSLSLISGSVGTTETAACWIVITASGRFAYTTNTFSNTISGYAIHQGALTLLDADGVTATTDAGPIDLALSRNSQFIYALNGAAGTIQGWAVNGDGSLTLVPGASMSGLPAGANGLAAR